MYDIIYLINLYADAVEEFAGRNPSEYDRNCRLSETVIKCRSNLEDAIKKLKKPIGKSEPTLEQKLDTIVNLAALNNGHNVLVQYQRVVCDNNVFLAGTNIGTPDETIGVLSVSIREKIADMRENATRRLAEADEMEAKLAAELADK